MAVFEGLPTFVGGFDVERNLTSDEVYQYHWKEDKWLLREDLTLTAPRTEGLLIEIPRDILGLC